MTEPTIKVENLKVSRPEESGLGPIEHWQWILIKFIAALRALKSTRNLYFGFTCVVFFGNRIGGVDHEELLSLIISFSAYPLLGPPFRALAHTVCDTDSPKEWSIS